MNNTTYTNEPNPGSSSPLLSTLTFEQIYNLIEKKFVQSVPKYPIDAMPLYIMDPIPYQTGNQRQYDEEDFSSFAHTKPQGVPAAKGTFGIGYYKQLFIKRIALEFDLTFEARTQNKWYDVTQITARLIKTVPYRTNLDMTQLLITFANGTSYVDMDGYTIDTTTGDENPIAFNAHTLAFSNLTWTNIIPGAPQFSKSAIILAETIAKNNTLDNYGVPGALSWTHIWCAKTPSVMEAIQQFIRSTTDNTQANPQVINTYLNRYSMLVLAQIDTYPDGTRDTTKSNYWGLAALGGVIRGDRLQAYFGQSEAPNMKASSGQDGSNADDFSRDIWKYGVRAGYGLCVVSGRGILYSFAPNS